TVWVRGLSPHLDGFLLEAGRDGGTIDLVCSRHKMLVGHGCPANAINPKGPVIGGVLTPRTNVAVAGGIDQLEWFNGSGTNSPGGLRVVAHLDDTVGLGCLMKNCGNFVVFTQTEIRVHNSIRGANLGCDQLNSVA